MNTMREAMGQTSWKLPTVRARLVLILDVAILLWRRQHSTAPTQRASLTVKYGSADSSPHGIRDLASPCGSERAHIPIRAGVLCHG